MGVPNPNPIFINVGIPIQEIREEKTEGLPLPFPIIIEDDKNPDNFIYISENIDNSLKDNINENTLIKNDLRNIKEKKDNIIYINSPKDYLESSEAISQPYQAVSLENWKELYEKGYLPIFIKLKDYKPSFYCMEEESTLKSLVKQYLEITPETDEDIIENIKLYYKERLLDINRQIKYLKLPPLAIVTDKNKQ